jgi:hypothetical protein
MFSNQIRVSFGGPWNGKVGIFYGHLEYITAIWNMLWPFGNLVAVWYIYFRFGILNKEKSGIPVRPKKRSWVYPQYCVENLKVPTSVAQ